MVLGPGETNSITSEKYLWFENKKHHKQVEFFFFFFFFFPLIIKEEIKELEAKLRLLHLKETAITVSITDNNQEIELVKREISQEMQGIETEKEVLKENEIALRRRGERLEDEEREQDEKMLGVKEMESR